MDGKSGEEGTITSAVNDSLTEGFKLIVLMQLPFISYIDRNLLIWQVVFKLS